MVVRLKPGQLDQEIDIQNRQAGIAGTRGQDAGTFKTVETVLASVRQVTGTEVRFGREITATADHLLEMHYTPNLTEQSQLVWGTRTLGVEAIDNIENKNRWLIVDCKEVK